MARDPVVVYDGMDDLPDIHATVTAPCPVCDAACIVNPAEVAFRGTGIGWGRSPHVVVLHDTVLAQMRFDTGEFDGSRTLRSTNDRLLSPWVAMRTCGSCGEALLAVVSWGEVQPARWRLVFEGLVRATPVG